MLQRCKDGKMNNKDFQLLFDFCTKSCVRVLKTIRHHVYSLNKNQVEDIERTSLFQAIHLVRRSSDTVVYMLYLLFFLVVSFFFLPKKSVK